MALNARLQMRQSQSLVMTPQLLQSIRLLQLTHQELSAFIDDQIEQNPLLERGDGGDAPSDDRRKDTTIEDGSDEERAMAAVDNGAGEPRLDAASIAETFDTSMDNVFPDDNSETPGSGPVAERQMGSDPSLPFGSDEFDGADLEDYCASKLSLRDHVTGQIALLVREPSSRLIASEIIDALDERGYVELDVDAISERLNCGHHDVYRVLETVQQCEPAGLFARNLAECLSLQCARADRLDPAMRTLIDNLELLARRDFKTLSRLCCVDEGDLIDMLAEIRRLDPHPGFAFEASGAETIIHDVTVRESADGSWHIELNADALPKVLVNRDYHATLSRSAMSAEEKTFVTDCMQNAGWLERSLDQRANTILKVATEIVKQQDRFLVEGVRGLKPMTMKAVADAINMHESTISRVASNKYMMTPRGLFELRYFFTVAISGTGQGDDAHSSQAVRERIRELVARETIEDVLSDDTLVDMLRADGIDIARRTVAKYRETMNIPSSVRRRREMKARQGAAA